MTIPLRVLRTNETYMNDEIKCLMKERNRLCRNLALNRTAWLQKCKKMTEKVEEAKRMSWRNHLEKIKAGKDARLAWRTVRGLKNNEQQPTKKALQYRGQLYHRDQAKVSVYIQQQSLTSVDSVRKRPNQLNTSGSDAQPSQGPVSATTSGPSMMNSCAFHSQL